MSLTARGAFVCSSVRVSLRPRPARDAVRPRVSAPPGAAPRRTVHRPCTRSGPSVPKRSRGSRLSLGDRAPRLEDIGVDVLEHVEVRARGLEEVLPERDHVDAHLAEVAEGPVHLVVVLAHAEHEARLGVDIGLAADPIEDRERLLVVGPPVPHRPLEALDRLDVVGDHVRPASMIRSIASGSP